MVCIEARLRTQSDSRHTDTLRFDGVDKGVAKQTLITRNEINRMQTTGMTEGSKWNMKMLYYVTLWPCHGVMVCHVRANIETVKMGQTFAAQI